PDEIERAEVSLTDLEPQDCNGFLKAGHAMADHQRWGRAVAFCRQASLLQPNVPQPYADALGYAELQEDPEARAWAAGHLLRQDWPVDNAKLQAKAKDKTEALAQKLAAANRKAESDRLLGTLAKAQERDLVIKLNWQGNADLDLKVQEPCGSACSSLNRQTVG